MTSISGHSVSRKSCSLSIRCASEVRLPGENKPTVSITSHCLFSLHRLDILDVETAVGLSLLPKNPSARPSSSMFPTVDLPSPAFP
ncbi:hypothetical protein Mapa_012399 [Marchantia paleacea]|nr:hypothetical protein Mapa_012399 [Marchantia paleacea]